MARYDGPIVDVDVHHRPASPLDLVPYLPERWRVYVAGNGKQTFPLWPPIHSGGASPNNGRRSDAFGPDGGFPGSSYEMLRSQVLDRYGYYRCTLTHDVGEFATHLNQHFATAMCRAANDWNADTWLSNGDDRLYSVIVVPSAIPEEAAAEVRRLAGHPRMSAVLMAGNALGRPLGDPIYHPIYAAAAEAELPISIHFVPAGRPNSQVTAVGGRLPTIEQQSQGAQEAMHYISSFIVHGVFEKFPNLKFLIREFGVAWLPYTIWRLDQNYDLLRFESPWVKKWPQEYIHDHVRLSTQPIEEGTEPGGMAQLLGAIDGIEDTLCFSTDYPHWSMDDPTYVARLLPEAWLRKVFCDNACDVHGWEAPTTWPVKEPIDAQPVSSQAG